jgi:3-oxoadipate enol-lactonase
VIPGLHGRWEWSKPALRALARRCHTISYSLAGDFGSRWRFDRRMGFENYLRQLDTVLDLAGTTRVALCGVSFGGFIALRYAAERPDRVSALVLASAPGPGFQPNAQQSAWLAKPWISAPAFLVSSPARIWPEVCTALPRWTQRLGFLAGQTLRCAAAPMIPSFMAARMRHAAAVDFCGPCSRIAAPAMIVSGEEELDRVVPVTSTRSYASLIPNAEYRVIHGTGHMASLTRPELFADIVSEFVHAHHH